MNKSLENTVLELGRLTLGELRGRYEALYGESCFSRHKPYIVKRIVWKLQAGAEGVSLAPELHRRAELLARDGDVRLTGRSGGAGLRQVLPCSFSAPAAVADGFIRKHYKGRNIVVQVVDGGFVYDGETYRSLSAVAKKITGSHINGKAFFKVAI